MYFTNYKGGHNHAWLEQGRPAHENEARPSIWNYYKYIYSHYNLAIPWKLKNILKFYKEKDGNVQHHWVDSWPDVDAV
jgi:hypothetical protein